LSYQATVWSSVEAERASRPPSRSRSASASPRGPFGVPEIVRRGADGVQAPAAAGTVVLAPEEPVEGERGEDEVGIAVAVEVGRRDDARTRDGGVDRWREGEFDAGRAPSARCGRDAGDEHEDGEESPAGARAPPLEEEAEAGSTRAGLHRDLLRAVATPARTRDTRGIRSESSGRRY
jgi:hypothetical protein